jgi:propanol-preferring alcohol dehydrogenase
MMKAVRISAIGEKLTQENVGTPVPEAGEVLVAVKAAGICHSDAHYRSGIGSLAQIPITPGHEVAGVIECLYCRHDIGQFCPDVAMIGKDRDGGYAEYICVPEQNAFTLPDEIPFEHAAVMMCSFATALHALRKARFAEGESVAVFGAGGLGVAAIELAVALGASRIFAVDNNSAKVETARSLGAIGIDASSTDAVEAIMESTGSQGVDVALEFVGLPITSEQAVKSLGVQGRAAMVGLASTPTPVDMYRDVIGKEREIIGVSDHLPEEIDELISFVQQGRLDIAPAISKTVPLDEMAINTVFEELDSYTGTAIRTVISIE